MMWVLVLVVALAATALGLPYIGLVVAAFAGAVALMIRLRRARR
jgi:hypothetical protein